MTDPYLRYLSCDGFDGQQYFLNDPVPRIVGLASISNGDEQRQWEFTLFLPEPVGSLEEIDWAALMPADNVTRWLAVDPRARRIQIEPAQAVPDLPAPP